MICSRQNCSKTNTFHNYIVVGGMIFIPQKHKGGLRVKYNSGFYIATNVYPDFGNEVDCVAIRKLLEVFQTKSLRSKDNTVAGKILRLYTPILSL